MSVMESMVVDTNTLIINLNISIAGVQHRTEGAMSVMRLVDEHLSMNLINKLIFCLYIPPDSFLELHICHMQMKLRRPLFLLILIKRCQKGVNPTVQIQIVQIKSFK